MTLRPALAFGAFALVSTLAAHAATPAPVAQYGFNNSFASSVAGAPALTVTDPLGQSGFNSDSALGVTQTVWSFRGTNANASQSGLTLNTAGLITAANVYSVELVIKFNERQGAWRRILDTTNRQTDNGFYVDPSNNLNVFPVAGGAAFTNNVYHDVFLVNNAGNVTFYLDGSAQATVTTTVMDLDASRTMTFFLDNVVGGGQNEWSSGSVALIRVYNAALSEPPPPVPEPATVALLLAGIGVVAGTARRRVRASSEP